MSDQREKPRLNFFGASHFLQHYLHGDSNKHEHFSGRKPQNFRAMVISKLYVNSLRSLFDNQLNFDMVSYNRQTDLYKLRFMGTFSLVHEQFILDFFRFLKPRRFAVSFGYDERVIPTRVIDSLKDKFLFGATNLKINSNSCTNSINYALETLGNNLEFLHCSSTQLIRPFINSPESLKFKTYSGSSGTLNHVLAFDVENIDMHAMFIYDKREHCLIQSSLKSIKLKCKFEEFGMLCAYLSDLKDNVPNIQKLIWNAEFNSSAEKVKLSNVTNFLITTMDSILEKLKTLTKHVKHLEFKYFKSIQLLEEEGVDPNKWTQDLEKMGYFVENCVNFQLYNDPHGSLYQKNIQFNHSSDSIKASIAIGVMFSWSYV